MIAPLFIFCFFVWLSCTDPSSFLLYLYTALLFFFSVVFLLTHCLIFIQALFDRGDYIICNLLSIAELKRLYDCDSICRDFSLHVLLNRLFHYIVCSSYLHI